MRLYEQLGFQLQPDGLAVLRLALDGPVVRARARIGALGRLLAVLLAVPLGAAPPTPIAAACRARPTPEPSS